MITGAFFIQMKYLQNDLIVPLEDLIESEISGIKV